MSLKSASFARKLSNFTCTSWKDELLELAGLSTRNIISLKEQLQVFASIIVEWLRGAETKNEIKRGKSLQPFGNAINLSSLLLACVCSRWNFFRKFFSSGRLFSSNFKPAFLETHSTDSRWLSPRLIICVLYLWISPLVCPRACAIKPNLCSQRAHELYFLGYYPLYSLFLYSKTKTIRIKSRKKVKIMLKCFSFRCRCRLFDIEKFRFGEINKNYLLLASELINPHRRNPDTYIALENRNEVREAER